MSRSAIPDLVVHRPDLTPPPMSGGEPGAGRRVRAVLPAWGQGDIHYALYLPANWRPGGRYPVIVEYAGNEYRSPHGDICTGRVEDCSLGFGLTGGTGCIWLCLPCVDPANGCNARAWWGDIEATVAFCRAAVQTACTAWGGDPAAVILCGFSRGGLACNYIGLHDDATARLWRGFFAVSHYDGVRPWPYPDSDRPAALARLRRLGRRPVFFAREFGDTQPPADPLHGTIAYLSETGMPLDLFTLQVVPIRNHTDRWVLHDLPARQALRRWLEKLLASPAT